jgi:nucleoside 2-deoxyribosyltransferase
MRVFLSVSYSAEVDTAGIVRAAYRRDLEEIISFLEQQGHQVFCGPREDGWKLNEASPGEALLLDLKHIDACDVLVALVGGPVSGGVQWELGIARNKHIVLVSPANEPLSYINQGLVDSGMAQFVEYASREDLLAQLQTALTSLVA